MFDRAALLIEQRLHNHTAGLINTSQESYAGKNSAVFETQKITGMRMQFNVLQITKSYVDEKIHIFHFPLITSFFYILSINIDTCIMCHQHFCLGIRFQF
jgi:hypothetical protein